MRLSSRRRPSKRSNLFNQPTNGKECVRRGVLGESVFQRFDQGVAFLHDRVLGREDLLPLAALLPFEFLYLLPNRVLFVECDCLARLPPQRFDLLFGVRECFLGRQHHVIGPLFQFLARLIKVDAVLFERTAHGGLGVPLRVSVEALLHGDRDPDPETTGRVL